MKIRLFAMLLLTLALAACSGGGGGNVSADQNTFSIPLAQLDDGKAHYFEAEVGQIDVRFFALRSADGVYRAAFDACDVCYESKKGYSQDGDFMVCNNCGMRFHSTRINEVKGGCNPAPLNREVEGDQLVIAMTDIATGKHFF